MSKELLGKYGIKQIGYYVESIEETAQAMRDRLGAGPFIDMGVAEPASLLYHGEPAGTRTRCALGNIGTMQLELIEVKTDEPDVYKDLGHYGMHHLCIWADDVDAVVAEFKEAGIEPAMEMVSGQGLKVVYFDAREQLGSFIEVNAPIEQLAGAVAAVHANATPETPTLLTMQDLMAMMSR